ncbi:MAG: hypothetical protein L0323_03940 [Planctomycetes bacterium]|nr:hypothetical protein [Planctomycetota bacterium]
MGARVLRALATALLLAEAAGAQVAAPNGHWEPYFLDTGFVSNPGSSPSVVFQQTIALAPAVPWIRVTFTLANLPKGSAVRVTSLLDGEQQTLDGVRLQQWSLGTAYLNGSSVLVELIAGAGTAANQLRIDQLWVGDPPSNGAAPPTVCGGTDDRVPASHPAVGRLLTAGLGGGCSAWILDGPAGTADRCHLSAGDCFPGLTVLQFDVPDSTAGCALVHPPASQQFAVDPGSLAFLAGGIGNDYAVFRCFSNPTTGLTTFQEQGAALAFAATTPAPGATVRVTGFGTDGTDAAGAGGGSGNCNCPVAAGTGSRNQVQQTSTGPLLGSPGTQLDYQVDVCGGTAGAPVIEESSGLAVGIHTHGGCSDPVGSTANHGTAPTNPGLAAAISVSCVPGPGNDECAGAIPLATGLNAGFSNFGSSLSSAPWSCGPGGSDVWFTYTATCTGPATISLCGPGFATFDAMIQVFSGGCGGLLPLACSDDVCGAVPQVLLAVTAGTTYRLRVGGYSGSQGSFDLLVLCGLPGPGNDECVGATPIFDGVNTVRTNGGATLSGPAWTCGPGGSDVWHAYTATCSGTTLFTLCPPGSTSYDTVLSVYGGSCGSVSLLGCNDDSSCGLPSTVTVPTVAGTTYFLRVGGTAGATGSYRLAVSNTCECAVFAENFGTGGLGAYVETDAAGNPAATLWHGEASCNGAVPIPATMGANAAAYNLGNFGIFNYATGPFPNAGAIESPVIPALPSPNLLLSFEYAKETEGGGNGGFDQCFVEARPVGGPWATYLQILGNSPCPASTAASVLLTGITNDWQHRFRFDTVDGSSNAFQGWWIDNVKARTGGAFSTRATACGAPSPTLTATGLPALGGSVAFVLGGVTGAPVLWVGLPVSAPLCAPGACLLGASLSIVLPVDSIAFDIPCDPTLAGGAASVQGANLFGPGGCLLPLPFSVSDTIDISLG